MTPAEAQKALDEVRVKRSANVRLRVVGSIDNPQSDGPGSKLQNARLEQNLSVVQVAQALKLRPDQVAAMETMNFSKLPGLGYGLGYVRAYAELVDLDDVKSLVEDFRSAWEPHQKHNEEVRGKTFDTRLVLPIGAVALFLLIAWAIVGIISNNILRTPQESVKSPDEAIKAWAQKNPQNVGRSVVAIDPLITIHALRDVHVNLRGQDGALVADKYLKAGQTLPADGLGRFIISTEDAGAVEIRGFGQTISVGGNHERVDWWRVPDLQQMAKDQEAAALANAVANEVTNSVTNQIAPPLQK